MANINSNSYNSYSRQDDKDDSDWNYDRRFHAGEKNSYFGIGPKDYWPSDEAIKEKVCDRLYCDHLVDASEMSVSVQDGVVTLIGMVADRKTKRMAEDCIMPIFGVKDVINSLKLKPDYGLVGGGPEWPI